MCSEEDPLAHFKRLQTGAKSIARQQHTKCHSVSFVMYISGAKFEEHCSNISRDIVD